MKKYIQIYTYLINECIPQKNLGDFIPNEVDLAEQFSVSRMTVNKAIKLLENEGILQRIRGKGTLVISHENNTIKNLGKLQSYSEDMKRRNIEPVTKLVSYNFISHPSEELKLKLKLRDTDKLHNIVRVRYFNSKPITVDYTYISTRFIKEIDLSKMTGSLFRFYEEDMNVKIEYSNQEIYAENATSEISELLDIKKGTALLVIDGVTHTNNDDPFEYTRVYYEASSYKIRQRANRH